MNVLAPVSLIMTTKLFTVSTGDTLLDVKKVFEEHNIHHVPVVHGRELVGIISKSDFLAFQRGCYDKSDELWESARLGHTRVEDIMTKGMAKVDSKEPIRTALEVFRTNRLHALPIVDDGELVGIVTPYDIIVALLEEPIALSQYQNA